MYSSVLNKSALRKIYLKERMLFSEEDIKDYSQAIFENFLKYFDLSKIKKVHCFLPIEKFNEIKTQDFINYFWEHHVNVFVPKLINGEMISVKLEKHTELIKNSWGILEPKSSEDESRNYFDIVITPLLYCDHNGNRIGYGKGFYDQFLKKINQNALIIGLNLFSPNEEIKDILDQDVPLDYLVTPTETLSFFVGISKFTK
jgi:5-formyltetrahydrofolate cyclo-ligase